MPIKNLTDRQSIKPRLPKLGVLRKGDEKTKKGPGKELPYFRFTSDRPEIVDAFYSVYSQEPKAINAVLMHETMEDNFSSWIESWDASGMVFRSDGDNWVIWRDGNSYSRESIPHVDHPDQMEIGRLEIIIPELLQLGFVGTVTVLTHSNHDLRHISSILLAVENQRGSLSGTTFVIRRVPEEISVPGWGDRADKRAKAIKYLVKLEAPVSVFDALQLVDGDDEELLQIAPPHWSTVEENRQTLIVLLKKNNISFETLFKACKVKDWESMVNYSGSGADAFNAAKALHEATPKPNSMPEQEALFPEPKTSGGAYS